MISLNKFYEVIEVAGQQLDPKYKAYRMDNGRGKPDMRICLGLGTCDTCDYFFVSDNIVLIEEKQLDNKIQEIKKQVSCLKTEAKDKFALEELLKLIRLKVYGSLFILSRLMLQCGECARLVGNNAKHDFWLVGSGVERKDIKFLMNIQNRLSSDLRSLFTEKYMEDVAVMGSQDLKRKLDNAPTP